MLVPLRDVHTIVILKSFGFNLQSKVISRVTVLNLMQFSLNLPLNYFSLIYKFCEIIKELR